MAKRKENIFAVTVEQKRARAGPEGDSDEDQERAFSRSVSQGCSASQSLSEEAGIIESIQLENFMNYASLGPVRFGANVNFVVGQNGKSALLTALIIGFGGKSLGSSFREFVKKGEDSADIIITLRNIGDDAFKPEIYGDSIIVHRHISVDGSASYEIKDQAGNLISRRKEELTEILDNFRIQVDNPISVLPQKMSRQLLRISNESDRYKFFMETTELEQMRESCAKLLARKARSQQEIEYRKVELEDLKRQGGEIEEHFQIMLALDKKLESLKREKIWAVVSETEKIISAMANDISIEDQQTAILSHDLEVSTLTYNETLQRYIDIHERVVKLNEEAAELHPKCLEAREIAKQTERAYRQATAFYNYSQNELRKLDQSSEQLQERIAELRQSLQRSELEKQQKISSLQEKINNFKDQEESLIQEIKYLHQSIEKNDEEHSKIREEQAFVQELLNVDQQQLKNLKDCKSDPLKRFGPQIPPLIEAIENAYKQGYFTRKPLGPLGACIRLRHSKYALAIESCLKGLLLDFFCDNNKDEQVLSELLKRFFPANCANRPQIIVAPFQCELYNIADRGDSELDCPTVFSALEIDEAVVANTLIDLRNIESVLLIENGSLATMHTQGRFKNCSKILTACGDQICDGRYYSCEDLKPIYLGDMEGEISYLEQEVESKIAKLLEFHEHGCLLQNDIKRNQEIIGNHYRHLREIKIKVTGISSEIRDLEDEEELQSIDLSVLEDEAEGIKGEIRAVERKVRKRKERMENLEQPKIDAEQRHAEYKLKCSQVRELVESLLEERNQTGAEVTNKHQCMMHYQNKLKEHIDALKVVKQELAMKERELERELAQASYTYPERVEVTRSSNVLDIEIGLLTQRIQSENYTHRSHEDILRQYKEANYRYSDIDGRVNNLKTMIETLDELLVQKYATYKKSRRNLSFQCKLFFNSLLSQWSFSGEMCFNHKEETLSIRVEPGEACDVGILSTNWHSFSNFLFILTLWAVTESPFRCLDTFDIYLDRKSRKIAIDMILWVAAHSYQNHQVILLCPQFLSSFPSSPFVEILQMPDIESNEKKLPYRPVTPKEH